MIFAVGVLVALLNAAATSAAELPEVAAPPRQPPTYAGEVAAILFQNCATCHRPGEVAPFPLLTYADASRRARQIARVVGDRLMPPWKPEPGYGHFQAERRLTEQQIATLRAWADAGAPEGDPNLAPPAPTFAKGWQLGEPDLVIEMPESYALHAEGPDVLRNFVVPVSVDADKMVGAIEFRPGNPKVVHHALVFLDGSGQARKLDAADPGPGYTSFGGPGFFPSGSLGGWAPGTTPRFLPDGVGRYMKKGWDAVIQIHYHPSGKPETDRSSVGVYYVRKPAKRLVGGIAVENWDIDIKPGDANHKLASGYTLPTATTFLSVAPHMHLLGRELKVRAVLPDGTDRPLIWIRRWDFDWQDNYVLPEPLTLPKGTRIEMETVHDNSADNPRNPNRPPARVRYGEESTDEMSLCIFEVTCDDLGDLLRLIGHNTAERKVVERAIEMHRRKAKG
ncbi:MAG TPA: hypothetical protein VF796_19275 [Humisphaera sp.]